MGHTKFGTRVGLGRDPTQPKRWVGGLGLRSIYVLLLLVKAGERALSLLCYLSLSSLNSDANQLGD